LPCIRYVEIFAHLRFAVAFHYVSFITRSKLQHSTDCCGLLPQHTPSFELHLIYSVLLLSLLASTNHCDNVKQCEASSGCAVPLYTSLQQSLIGWLDALQQTRSPPALTLILEHADTADTAVLEALLTELIEEPPARVPLRLVFLLQSAGGFPSNELDPACVKPLKAVEFAAPSAAQCLSGVLLALCVAERGLLPVQLGGAVLQWLWQSFAEGHGSVAVALQQLQYVLLLCFSRPGSFLSCAVGCEEFSSLWTRQYGNDVSDSLAVYYLTYTKLCFHVVCSCPLVSRAVVARVLDGISVHVLMR
jgi:Origin recognition complex (ORC) subunit 3 N-terminus